MRKIISLSMGVALAATTFAAVPAAAGSATVVHGGDCAMPGFGSGGELMNPVDEDGNFILGTVKKIVRNDNHWNMTCKGTDMPNDYGLTHEVAGFLCAVKLPSGEYVMTDDSSIKITKNGNALMKCKAPVVEETEG